MTTDEVIILITASSGDEAVKIATALVNEHLAACVNIVPEVRSLFFWEGRTQDVREVLLICKGRLPLVEAHHSGEGAPPYTVPEIVAIPIVAGSQEYLDWVRETVKV
jgi:periplasmic divalent cation tolerance protein